MNRGPLNAYAINGNIYLQLSMGAGISVNAALPITYGVMLGGSAMLNVQGSGSLYKRSYAQAGASTVVDVALESHSVAAAMGEGTASIVADFEGSPIVRYRPDLVAEISLSSSGDAVAVEAATGEGMMSLAIESELISEVREAPTGQGTLTIEVDSAAELMMRLNLSASSVIDFSADLESTVRPHPPRRSGRAYIRLEPRMEAHVGCSVSVESTANVITSGDMFANLRMVNGGMAVVELSGKGAARLGAYHYGAGKVTIGIEARGQSERWHHVHGSGVAKIEVDLKAERYGLPVIPTIYVPAHQSWQFQMPREDWGFTVPRDDWGQR